MRCRWAATPRRRRCSPATTRFATCSSGWSCGAHSRACYGWPGRPSTATSGSLLWIPALALDLAAPVAGYWLPGRSRAATTDYDIEGGHFAERCQLFIIIALGESIVVTGATAAEAGLTSTVVLCLVVAFLETAALWWLYFGAAEELSRAAMRSSDDPGRLARDAYTYLHLPIVAGIIATAVGAHLLIAEPGDPQHGVGLAMVLGGPALYLLGESLFEWRIARKTNPKRLTVAGLLILLLPLGGQVAALPLAVIVTTLLAGLAVWELPAPARNPLPAEKSG